MTYEEYKKLKVGDIVNFFSDDEANMHKKIYDWEIVQCDEYGIFIQNDFFVSKYYDVADALKYLVDNSGFLFDKDVVKTIYNI